MQGIRVVPEGESIDFAETADKSYTSEAQSPKVSAPIRGSFDIDASGIGTTSVPHTLTYSPVALAFYRMPSGRWREADNDTFGVETNRNNFVLRANNIQAGDTTTPYLTSATLQYKVWLLLDPAQEIVTL